MLIWVCIVFWFLGRRIVVQFVSELAACDFVEVFFLFVFGS